MTFMVFMVWVLFLHEIDGAQAASAVTVDSNTGVDSELCGMGTSAPCKTIHKVQRCAHPSDFNSYLGLINYS